MNLTGVKAVVFDWAGTLVDHGSSAPVEAFRKLFLQQGIKLSDTVIRRDMGLSKRAHLESLLEMKEVREAWFEQQKALPCGQAFEDLYEALLVEQKKAVAERSRIFPGVLELARQLEQKCIRIATTTGYPTEVITDMLKTVAKQGFEAEVTISASDVVQGRPAPWMIYKACEKLGIYPLSEVVVVDDTVAGVEAGRHAGCWSIGVSATGNLAGFSVDAACPEEEVARESRILEAEEQLYGAGAHFVIPSVANLATVIERIDAHLSEGGHPSSGRLPLTVGP